MFYCFKQTRSAMDHKVEFTSLNLFFPFPYVSVPKKKTYVHINITHNNMS
jgi:hypothetical protein